MNKRIADKRLPMAVALSLLLLAAFSYCLYQFYQMKLHARQLELLTRQESAITLLQARLPPAVMPASLLQEHLRQTAKKNQIPITSLFNSGEGVQVILPQLPFAHLIAWLAELQREQGIRVIQLTVERGQETGTVSVKQLLVRVQPPYYKH